MGIIVFIAFLLCTFIVLGKARECYFCGSRDPIKFSKFRTRGACEDCLKELEGTKTPHEFKHGD